MPTKPPGWKTFAPAALIEKETDMRSALLKTETETEWLVWFEKTRLADSPSLKLVVHFDDEEQREEFLAAALTHLDLLPPDEENERGQR